MKTFRDTEGREWLVAVTVDTVKRVRDLAGVDLLTAIDPAAKLFETLASDPVKLVDVLYAACRPEAEKRGVTDAQFGAAMAGDAIDAAVTALLEEVVSFFPKARRGMLGRALAKTRAAEDLTMARAGAEIDKIDVAGLVERAFGGSSGSSPAGSASTPGPSPSAS